MKTKLFFILKKEYKFIRKSYLIRIIEKLSTMNFEVEKPY
jgi:hypothetical protein